MRKVPLASAVAAMVLGVAGVGSFAAVSQASVPSPAKSQTLVFNVVFSPLHLIAANNVRDPQSPVALGDEIVEHTSCFPRGSMLVTMRSPAWSSPSRRMPSWLTALASSGCRAAPSASRPRPSLAPSRNSWW
jgi:hypothetical protein